MLGQATLTQNCQPSLKGAVKLQTGARLGFAFFIRTLGGTVGKICLPEILSCGKPTINKQGCFGCVALSRLVSHQVIIEESQLQL